MRSSTKICDSSCSTIFVRNVFRPFAVKFIHLFVPLVVTYWVTFFALVYHSWLSLYIRALFTSSLSHSLANPQAFSFSKREIRTVSHNLNYISFIVCYELDGTEIESRRGVRFSAPVQTGPGAHPASRTMGTESFPGVKSGRGVTLTLHPLLMPLVMKE